MSLNNVESSRNTHANFVKKLQSSKFCTVLNSFFLVLQQIVIVYFKIYDENTQRVF